MTTICRIVATLALAACVGYVAGCSKPAATPPSTNAPENRAAAPQTSHPERPPATADVRTTFDAKCAICHAESGGGDSHFAQSGIPDFTDPKWQARETDADLERVIRNGKGKFMPAWDGKLSDVEIAALIRFIRAFPERSGAKPDAVQS